MEIKSKWKNIAKAGRVGIASPCLRLTDPASDSVADLWIRTDWDLSVMGPNWRRYFFKWTLGGHEKANGRCDGP